MLDLTRVGLLLRLLPGQWLILHPLILSERCRLTREMGHRQGWVFVLLAQDLLLGNP